jgi:hypothetical protein
VALPLLFTEDGFGPVTVTVGTVLSTVNVVLALLALLVLPARSLAVAAFMVMPTVPSPEQLESVTVGFEVVPLVTPAVQLAVPVLLSVTPPSVRVNVVPPRYVTA